MTLFFYRFLYPINDIRGQDRHSMYRFCMIDILSHDFTVISSGCLEGTIHAKIFAHKRRHYTDISFCYPFSNDENVPGRILPGRYYRIIAQQQILKHSLKHHRSVEKYCNLLVQKGDDCDQIDYYSQKQGLLNSPGNQRIYSGSPAYPTGISPG
jgi:hypothetical protein